MSQPTAAHTLLFGNRLVKVDDFALGSMLLRDFDYLVRARGLAEQPLFGQAASAYDWRRESFRILHASATFQAEQLTQLFLVRALGRPEGEFDNRDCFVVCYLETVQLAPQQQAAEEQADQELRELFVAYEGQCLKDALKTYDRLAAHYQRPLAERPSRRIIHNHLAEQLPLGR